MPSIKQNYDLWNAGHEWKDRGDRWSTVWGGPEMQWVACIYPRIMRYLPSATILEIAPGHGRWTQFLKNYCSKLIAVDIAPACIDECRQRFSDDQHIEYHVNDGKSLAMLPDNSIDFAFSFDSLVHAEADVLSAYVEQLARKLTDNGVIFFHHSNLGEYPWQRRMQKYPLPVQNVLKRLNVMEERVHWRAWSMSAAIMRDIANQYGLKCVSQELIPWSTNRALIDCLTVISKSAIGHDGSGVWQNHDFMKEAQYLGKLAKFYGSGKGK